MWAMAFVSAFSYYLEASPQGLCMVYRSMQKSFFGMCRTPSRPVTCHAQAVCHIPHPADVRRFAILLVMIRTKHTCS